MTVSCSICRWSANGRRNEAQRNSRERSGALLKAGVPLLSGLESAAQAVDGAYLRQQLLGLGDPVANGARLSQSLAQIPRLPPLVAQLAAVGEEAGQLAPDAAARRRIVRTRHRTRRRADNEPDDAVADGADRSPCRRPRPDSDERCARHQRTGGAMTRRRRAKQEGAAGFALFELLAVMAILALLIGLAAPLLRPPPARLQLEASVRKLCAALRGARARAIESNSETAVAFDLARKSYVAPAAMETFLPPQTHIDLAIADFPPFRRAKGRHTLLSQRRFDRRRNRHFARRKARDRRSQLADRRGAMRHVLTRRSDGFILIEAFAAFAILTLALAALITGLFGAVRNDDRASFMTQAVRAARSQFAALGVSTPAAPGVSAGRTEDGLAYVLTVRFVATPPPANPQAPRLQAFWAHIDLTRARDATGRGTTLGFDALKVVPPGDEAPR